ncbi:unnamed protein product [Linum tenue]|uniref:TF-B3 domain-containing protein n=1 Tax=Linum tenue TaxID=586396 RepID=A0AAV0L7T6_9ROSI|nr:unnamed protein product [Linum tenue]
MESFGMKDGGQSKKAKATFGLIRRGNASDMEKMKPHFFRVMLEFMLQDSKIIVALDQYIPTEFVKRYRSRLGSSATLKVDNGDTWEVELVTDDDGMVWLVKGWEDFRMHHSLKQGDILVFRLEQNSLFHVMVFEPTASEKNYRHKDLKGHGKLLNEIKVEDEFDVEKETGKLKEVKTKKSGGEGKRKVKLAATLETPNHQLEIKTEGISEPRKANASTSSENPNFFVTINKSHMKRRHILLPTRFVYEHMIPEHGTVPENRKVMVSDEKGLSSWSFSFVLLPRRGGGRGQASFSGGWPAFRNANALKPGDVCQFELVFDGQMKVTIRRA